MQDPEAPPQVTVLSNSGCSKAKSMFDGLVALGVAPAFVDIDRDEAARSKFAAMFADGRVKAPALIIGAKRIRNPAIADLEKFAIRHGALKRRMLHDQASQRYVWPMKPSDAFASYVLRDGQMTIGHIEIDKTMRCQGLGRVLARELLQELVDRDQPAVLTCSFMRKVAREDPVFSQGFL